MSWSKVLRALGDAISTLIRTRNRQRDRPVERPVDPPQHPDVTVFEPTAPPVVTPSPPRLTFDLSRLVVNRHALGDIAATVNGGLVYTFGQPDARSKNYASVGRSLVTTAWGMLIQDGTIDPEALHEPVAALDTPTARRFDSSILLKHLLSYTSQAQPPGARWAYSSGDHWPMQHRIIEELAGTDAADYLNRWLFSFMRGDASAFMTSDDRTLRVEGSVRDLTHVGEFWRLDGRLEPGAPPLLPPGFMTLATAGGPNGDGLPKPTEGYQFHLVKNGRHTEGPMPGVPDDAYFAYGAVDRAVLAVVPSLQLVVARRKSDHGYPVESFLGAVCGAIVPAS